MSATIERMRRSHKLDYGSIYRVHPYRGADVLRYTVLNYSKFSFRDCLLRLYGAEECPGVSALHGIQSDINMNGNGMDNTVEALRLAYYTARYYKTPTYAVECDEWLLRRDYSSKSCFPSASHFLGASFILTQIVYQAVNDPYKKRRLELTF